MTRQNYWGRRTIERLRAVLGNVCNHCGARENLELDCIKPQGHGHHAAGANARACFYRRQLRQGNLQILCRSCHEKKTADENAERNTQG